MTKNGEIIYGHLKDVSENLFELYQSELTCGVSVLKTSLDNEMNCIHFPFLTKLSTEGDVTGNCACRRDCRYLSKNE